MSGQTRLGTKLLLALSITVPLSTATARTEPSGEQQPCRGHLVPWNCAGLFSGSFEWRSALTGGSGTLVNIQEQVTVVVKAGAATCTGSRKGTITTQDTETQILLTIGGPGLVAVEYGTNTEDPPLGPWYRITVQCPTPEGEEINTDRRSGGKETQRVVSVVPKSFDGEGQSSDKQPGTEKDKTLQGSKVDPHPESDTANGLSGMLTTTWKLVKS